MEKVNCKNCGKAIDEDDLFCEFCGSKVEHERKTQKKENEEAVKKSSAKESNSVRCLTCGAKVSKNDKFCKECGTIVGEKKKNSSSNKYIYLVIAVLVTILVCVFGFCVLFALYADGDNDSSVIGPKREVTVTDNGIADAVEKVYDSVVVVKNYVDGRLYSTGTGVVYKSDDKYGYILTNNHVISGGTEVKVVFTNKKEVKVDVVGSDEYSDIAVLRVDKSNVVSVASIGKSDSLRVGDTAFAVGAPLDASTYSWTVTRGIISGKDRVVEVNVNNSSSKYVMEVLQTDAAINQGNSGGPLCNSNGEVIGITNMKLASTTIEGMGFAIPIEKAVSYADKFVSGENISRPYIGVSIYDMTGGFFNQVNQGIYIDSVEKGSPAEDAGLKKGDKILKVDGVEVSDTSYFKYELYKHNVGDKVKITVERDGKSKDFTVKLGSNSKDA